MREHVCETNNPPIKSLITDRYVPWYCDIDNQKAEWEPYATGLSGFTLPLICRIDPHNPDVYMDRSTNEQDAATFYNRLLSGIDDWDSDDMPDEWERQYGLNPLVNDASGDLDNDRFTNLKEYQEGTLPNNRNSRPRRGMPWLPLLLEND